MGGLSVKKGDKMHPEPVSRTSKITDDPVTHEDRLRIATRGVPDELPAPRLASRAGGAGRGTWPTTFMKGARTAGALVVLSLLRWEHGGSKQPRTYPRIFFVSIFFVSSVLSDAAVDQVMLGGPVDGLSGDGEAPSWPVRGAAHLQVNVGPHVDDASLAVVIDC